MQNFSTGSDLDSHPLIEISEFGSGNKPLEQEN